MARVSYRPLCAACVRSMVTKTGQDGWGTLIRLRVLFALTGLVVLFAATAPAQAEPASSPAPAAKPVKERRVCSAPRDGEAECHAHVRTKGDGATPAATANYSSGLRPGD